MISWSDMTRGPRTKIGLAEVNFSRLKTSQTGIVDLADWIDPWIFWSADSWRDWFKSWKSLVIKSSQNIAIFDPLFWSTEIENRFARNILIQFRSIRFDPLRTSFSYSRNFHSVISSKKNWSTFKMIANTVLIHFTTAQNWSTVTEWIFLWSIQN